MKIIIIILILIYVESNMILEFGLNFNPKIKERITNLLAPFQNVRYKTTLSFGNTTLSRRYIRDEELNELGSEGYIVRSQTLAENNLIIVCNGNSFVSTYLQHPSKDHPLGKI